MKKNEKTNQINKKSKTEQTNMSHQMVNRGRFLSEEEYNLILTNCQLKLLPKQMKLKWKFLISSVTFLLTKQTC